jgi:hypothetical protein
MPSSALQWSNARDGRCWHCRARSGDATNLRCAVTAVSFIYFSSSLLLSTATRFSTVADSALNLEPISWRHARKVAHQSSLRWNISEAKADSSLVPQLIRSENSAEFTPSRACSLDEGSLLILRFCVLPHLLSFSESCPICTRADATPCPDISSECEAITLGTIFRKGQRVPHIVAPSIPRMVD